MTHSLDESVPFLSDPALEQEMAEPPADFHVRSVEALYFIRMLGLCREAIYACPEDQRAGLQWPEHRLDVATIEAAARTALPHIAQALTCLKWGNRARNTLVHVRGYVGHPSSELK